MANKNYAYYGKCALCHQKAELHYVEHHLLCSGCVKALYDHDAPYEELVLAVAFAEVMPEDTLGVELRENLRNRGISEAQFAQDIKKFIEQHMQ